MNASVETPSVSIGEDLENLPPAIIEPCSEHDETISAFSTATNDSSDLMAYFNKKFPEIDEKNKQPPPVSRRVRFFQEVRTRTNIVKILRKNGHSSMKSDGTMPEGDSISEADEHSACSEDLPEFYDEDDAYGNDYSDDDDDDDASLTLSHLEFDGGDEDQEESDQYLNKEEPIRRDSKDSEAMESKDSKRKERLQVGFRNRNRHCFGLGKTPVGKAFIRVKNKVLPPSEIRRMAMNQMRKFSSTQLECDPPPTWRQYRELEKKLTQTKLELAMIQTDLDHNKARLKRTTGERDWLHLQYSKLQGEHQESQDSIHEYKTLVQHLQKHAQDAAKERSTTLDMEKSFNNESFSLVGGGSIGHRSSSKVFNPTVWEADETLD